MRLYINHRISIISFLNFFFKLFFYCIVSQKHAQARAPGGGGTPRGSRTILGGFTALLASIWVGILGAGARFAATGSRPSDRFTALLVQLVTRDQ